MKNKTFTQTEERKERKGKEMKKEMSSLVRATFTPVLEEEQDESATSAASGVVDDEKEKESLVKNRYESAKEKFFAKARENRRQKKLEASGEKSMSFEQEQREQNSGDGHQKRLQQQQSPAGGSSTSGAGSLLHELLHQQQQQQNAGSAFERRSQVVKSVVATSSIFNVGAPGFDSFTASAADNNNNSNINNNNSNSDNTMMMMNDANSQRHLLSMLGNQYSTNTVQAAMSSVKQTLLMFPGFGGNLSKLDVWGGDVEPMSTHIERLRETALLAALEANKSKTANETRQAYAAATLQSFFRMAVARRRYLRHRLTLSKQLRAIDRLKCCKAAMLLSRFCRGHLVRREYRIQREAIAARRLDNLSRRMKIERSTTPANQKVPPSHLVPGVNCTTEEWVIDILTRYNMNFVHGIRALVSANNAVDAIGYFDAHIKCSTVSTKEVSNEFLAERLLTNARDQVPAHVLQEIMAKTHQRRRRY